MSHNPCGRGWLGSNDGALMAALLGLLISSCTMQDASLGTFVGDSIKKTNSDDVDASTEISGPVKNVITKYCSDCHTNYHDTWKSIKTNKEWQKLGLVVAGDPENSPLLIRSKFGYGGSLANMPSDTYLFSQFTRAEFEVLRQWIDQMPAADFIPPRLSNLSPSGILASQTATTTLALTTDEKAECRYATSPNSSFESMTIILERDHAGLRHQSQISGLTDGNSYTYYLRCQDEEGNTSLTDTMVSFAVANDNAPPVLSALQPSGTLNFGTTQAILRVTTDELSSCRYSTTRGQTFSAMPQTLLSPDGLAHAATITGLSNDRSFLYYVRCRDSSGNVSAESAASFSVNGNSSGPTISNLQPAGTLVAGTTQASLSLQTSMASSCRYSTTAGTLYSAMTSNFNAAGNGLSHTATVTNLTAGQAYSFYIRCRNSSSIDSTESVIAFSVMGDTSSPTLSNFSPQGLLTAGVTQTTLSVRTNEPSQCRYSTNAGVAYASMTLNLTASSNRLDHTRVLTNLAGGSTFNYYIKCVDDSGNANTSDSRITFSTDAVKTSSQIIQTSCIGCHNEWRNYSDADYQRFALVVAGNPSQSSFIRRLRFSGGVANMPAPVGGSLYQAFTQSDYNTLEAWVRNMTPVPTDIVPPAISSGQPSGVLAMGTTSATISVATNEAADCRYSTSPNLAFASMASTLSSNGSKTSHSALINGLRDGFNYFYFVRCRDAAGNATMSDFSIAFSVLSNVDTAPPIVTDPQPSGSLAVGTAQATIRVTTNESATCRYSSNPGTTFVSMNGLLSATNAGLTHSGLLTGLVDGRSYNYYVKCLDGRGNTTTSDTRVSFSIRATTGNLFQSSQESIRLGDRHYIKSYLDAIFGSEAGPITKTHIYDALSKFGGPCDPQLETNSTCPDVDIADQDAPVLPTTSTPREGQRIKTCNVLVFDDITLQNAIRSALDVNDLSYLSSAPIPTDADIQKAYQMFYPGRTQAADSIVEALRTLGTQARESGKPLDPWRYILLTLCYAPDWQMP